MADPAAVFCIAQGGEFLTRETEAGSQGLCRLADGQEVDAWENFRANHQSRGD
nr:DUF333 domain-containing protein [Tropicimonas sp. IMCC34043]